MPSAAGFALVAVPLVAFGYLFTSFAYCEAERWGRDGNRLRRVPPSTVSALAALIATTVAYYATDLAVSRDLAYVLSPVPLLIAPWDQVALWTGVAAVWGQTFPVWNGFRGGSGLAAAAIVGFVYVPMVLVVACVAWFAGMLASTHKAVPTKVALVAGPLVAWIGWAVELDPLWGVTFGPDVMLTTTLAVLLVVARLRSDARRAA